MRLRSRPSSGSPPGTPAAVPALLVTGDHRLHDEVARLAAAAALRIEVVDTVEAALRRWTSAGVVLVGSDLVAPLAGLGPPPRPEVHVLTGGDADELYRHALGLGAQ